MELLVTSAASCRGTSSGPAGIDNGVTRSAPRPTERGRSASRPPQPPVPPDRPARLNRAYVGHGLRLRGAAAPSAALQDKRASCQRRRPTERRGEEDRQQKERSRPAAQPSPPAPPREESGAGARPPPRPQGRGHGRPPGYLSAPRAALPSARPALPFKPLSADRTRKRVLTRGAADWSRWRPPSMRGYGAAAAGPEGRRSDAALLGAGSERRRRAGGPLLPVALPARPGLRRPVRRAATGRRCAARRRAQLRHAAARGMRRQHGCAGGRSGAAPSVTARRWLSRLSTPG